MILCACGLDFSETTVSTTTACSKHFSKGHHRTWERSPLYSSSLRFVFMPLHNSLLYENKSWSAKCKEYPEALQKRVQWQSHVNNSFTNPPSSNLISEFVPHSQTYVFFHVSKPQQKEFDLHLYKNIAFQIWFADLTQVHLFMLH